MSSHGYIPSEYWGALLQQRFDLRGVGYPSLSLAFNTYLYRGMADSVARELTRAGLASDILGKSAILDVGSGTGFWINFWMAHGARQIVGMDLTAESIQRLTRQYPQLQFEQCDISDPMNVDRQERLDVISAMSVLNHIPSQKKWEQALENLGRMVRPGGYIFIMDPILRYRWWGKPFDVESNGRPRTVAEHAGALERERVRIVRVVPTVALLANPVDTRSQTEFRSLQLWWNLFCRIAIRERAMQWTGWLFYGLDRVLCRLHYMPSSKILVCRKDLPGDLGSS